MPVTNNLIPVVHVTNYQQYINADYLALNVNDRMPADSKLPENIYTSIAYMQVQRAKGVFNTTLCLNIKGRAYRFKLAHDVEAYYIAQVTIDYNTFSSSTAKDMQIRQLQQAFEAVVNKNIKQIVKAITTAYGHQ